MKAVSVWDRISASEIPLPPEIGGAGGSFGLVSGPGADVGSYRSTVVVTVGAATVISAVIVTVAGACVAVLAG